MAGSSRQIPEGLVLQDEDILTAQLPLHFISSGLLDSQQGTNFVRDLGAFFFLFRILVVGCSNTCYDLYCNCDGPHSALADQIKHCCTD